MSVFEMHENALLDMVSYAENVAVCRRKMLIEHFGQVYDEELCNALLFLQFNFFFKSYT